jgi:hypothetical protein
MEGSWGEHHMFLGFLCKGPLGCNCSGGIEIPGFVSCRCQGHFQIQMLDLLVLYLTLLITLQLCRQLIREQQFMV